MDRLHPESSGLWGVLGVGHGTGGVRVSGDQCKARGYLDPK